jgi:hypothetical protein
MTIAACYVSPEGVVLGADSTTTHFVQQPDGNQAEHYFNHGQKIYEIGDGGALAIVTWGLGSLVQVSYRTLVAQLGDDFERNRPESLLDVSKRWSEHFWAVYCSRLAAQKQRVAELKGQGRGHQPRRAGRAIAYCSPL